MALKKNNMAFKMKAGPEGPMLKNYGPMLMASPMREVTTFEKIKAAAKGLGAGVSRALKASSTENIGYSTRVGFEAGKKARKKALKQYDKD
tara:strand:+ start:91 stop:363 length:273 start_codon:yes stop_codon:yes gene_type:complete